MTHPMVAWWDAVPPEGKMGDMSDITQIVRCANEYFSFIGSNLSLLVQPCFILLCHSMV